MSITDSTSVKSASTAYAGLARGHTFGRSAVHPDRSFLPEPVAVPENSPGWDEVLAQYQAFCQASALSAKTISIRIEELRLLRRHFQVKPAQVTLTHLLAMQNRPIAPTSKQRNRSIYQMFFLWLYEEDYVPTNVARRLPKVKVPRRQPRPLSVSQVERMLEACRVRKARTYILLGAFQGMRVSEIARVRGEMFDLERNRIRFVGKGGHKRDMELHPVVRAEVAHYPRHGFWFPGSVNSKSPHVLGRSVGQSIHLAMRRAGIDAPELTAHSLRHFFATELLAAGTDIRIVQELMGHQQLNSTQIYTKVSQPQEREGLSRLPQVTLPGAHFSRRHRRVWLSLADAAETLDVPLSTATRIAQEQAWRYTVEGETVLYAAADVDASTKH